MSSLLTNNSSIAALNTLRTIESNMGRTQNQVSSGLRVGTSADNSAYWSIATTMRSDKAAISAVTDALAFGAATVDVAYHGVKHSIDIVSEIKAKLVAAREPGIDKTKINSELTELKAQLRTNAEGSSFNGENWLLWNNGEDSRDKQLVSSFNRSETGQVYVGTMLHEINTPPPLTSMDVQYLIDNGGVGEYGILTSGAFSAALGSAANYVLLKGATNDAETTEISVFANTTTTELDEMIGTVDLMEQRMTDVATKFGAIMSRISLQTELTKKQMENIDKGVGRLVDADMNSVSARLKALQTQTQLGTQALQIANASSDSLLQLFR